MNNWPLQRDCVKFYGNPYAPDFARKNIVQISMPFKCWYGSSPVSHISVHFKCADAFEQWLKQVWDNSGHNQSKINDWGMGAFSGSFVVRNKRAGTSPSMHSFGCAVDFDAARNPFKDHHPHFLTNKEAHDAVVLPFKALGGVWGGDWPNSTDGMHFQFALVA